MTKYPGVLHLSNPILEIALTGLHQTADPDLISQITGRYIKCPYRRKSKLLLDGQLKSDLCPRPRQIG